MKISLGLLASHPSHSALDGDLTLHCNPGEQQGRARIGLELTAFAALIVRVENKSTPVAPFEKDGARGGSPIPGNGRQRHRVRLNDFRGFRLLKPSLELTKWIFFQIVLDESGQAVVLPHV